MAYFASVAHTLGSREKIQKPVGEVGRPGPGRKGYQLLAALSWPLEVYKEVQVGVSTGSRLTTSLMCHCRQLFISLPMTNCG
jgi:hypothetical protein